MKPDVLLALAIGLTGCSNDAAGPITFGTFGPLSGDAGRGSFRFGVATAATQIEDENPHTDWYLWTQPVASGGLGKGTFVGDAVRGYSRAIDDLGLVQALGVDSYRFSIEWARIEPTKDHIDEAALAHYRDELTALRAMGIHRSSRCTTSRTRCGSPIRATSPAAPGPATPTSLQQGPRALA